MKKFLRRLAISVIALIVVVAAFYVEENWRGKHAWEKYRHEREAKGDSFEWSSIVPARVPDAENFAAIPLFAELFPKPPEHPRLEAIKLPDCPEAAGNWRVGQVENLAAWKTCFTNDNLLAALSKYDPILNEIAEASHRPKYRFPIHYEDSIHMLLPHLNHLRQLARDYRLRGVAELADGQSDAALADVQTCLRLANGLECEPVLFSFLVQNAVLDIAIQPVWEGLAAHRWSDTQLATLQAKFERLDQFDGFAKAIHAERLGAYSIGRLLINRPGERLSWMFFMESNPPPPLLSMIGWAVPAGWVYQNMLTIDRFYTATYLPSIDWEHRRISSSVRMGDESFRGTPITPYNILSKMLVPPVTRVAQKAAQSQTAIDQVVTACALERYRLAKGELPEKLDALVPPFIAKVPHDVIDGQPLRYRRTAADQFVLYSIGWNETDDGGQIVLAKGCTPPRPDFDKGDWVWSSPRNN